MPPTAPHKRKKAGGLEGQGHLTSNSCCPVVPTENSRRPCKLQVAQDKHPPPKKTCSGQKTRQTPWRSTIPPRDSMRCRSSSRLGLWSSRWVERGEDQGLATHGAAQLKGLPKVVASLFLVVTPGVTSSVLAPSSDALCYWQLFVPLIIERAHL